ncbi:hypothetical protein HU200_044704 [Digitaria exilis]|uniref:Plastocyanin-like domain-containing protein n=1 Tax=Digitaria exilis TaxID=1010633 RepID=A0A835B475_9POAL|nr:hypothetical protein HU200_044704 [Digitaria exilis]
MSHLHLLPFPRPPPRRRRFRQLGALNVYQRPSIPVPYPPPAGDFTLLVGDWYKSSNRQLRQTLDAGAPPREGLLINGVRSPPPAFNGELGKTYLFHMSSIGLKLRLVEVEGTHPVQNMYDSLDVHAGHSMASSSSTSRHWTGLRGRRLHAVLPSEPHGSRRWGRCTTWSVNQARSFRWNLRLAWRDPTHKTRSDHTTSRTLVLESSAAAVGAGRRRCAVNGVTFLADNYNIANVIERDSVPLRPGVRLNLHEFVEVVFQNTENELQSWHLDGYDFWVVYPNGWSATLVSLDNQGMWNLRSAIWDRQYLASSSTSGSGCHSRASPMTTASLPMPFSVAGPPAFHTDEQDEDLMQSWHPDGYDFWVVG